MSEPVAGPSGPGTVVMELGAGVGALILYTPAGLDGKEIEISPSDSESRLDVASSRIKIRGFASTARAIERRCRCPPLSLTPRSPITVS